MPFDDLLPDTFDVLEAAEAVVDGRLTETETVIARGVDGRLVWRDTDDVVYDPAGEIIIEADLLTRHRLALGNVLAFDDGSRFIVSGRPKLRRAAIDDHHTSAPVRSA